MATSFTNFLGSKASIIILKVHRFFTKNGDVLPGKASWLGLNFPFYGSTFLIFCAIG